MFESEKTCSNLCHEKVTMPNYSAVPEKLENYKMRLKSTVMQQVVHCLFMKLQN